MPPYYSYSRQTPSLHLILRYPIRKVIITGYYVANKYKLPKPSKLRICFVQQTSFSFSLNCRKVGNKVPQNDNQYKLIIMNFLTFIRLVFIIVITIIAISVTRFFHHAIKYYTFYIYAILFKSLARIIYLFNSILSKASDQ